MEHVKTLQKFSRAITPSNNTDECRIPAWHMHNPYRTVEPNANKAACMVVTAQSSSLSICEVYFAAVQIHLLHVLHKQNRTKNRVHPTEARQFKSRLTKQWKTQHTYNTQSEDIFTQKNMFHNTSGDKGHCKWESWKDPVHKGRRIAKTSGPGDYTPSFSILGALLSEL